MPRFRRDGDRPTTSITRSDAELIEDLLDFAATSQPVTTLEAVALGSLVFQCWQNVSTPSADLVLDFE